MENKIEIIEQKIKVGDYFINYVESKVREDAEKVLVLSPGGLGSSSSVFKYQIKNLLKYLPNYKIIAWDPPGLGKSIPPKRFYSPDLLLNDANTLKNLINSLKFKKVSLLGYSAGAVTSYFYASKYQEDVEKLILISPASFISDKQMNYIHSIRDITKWTDQMKGTLEDEYGAEYLKYLWEGYVDNMKAVQEKYTKEKIKPIVEKIKAETLILFGEKDPFIIKESDIIFLTENIKNSKVIAYDAGHNLQNQIHEEVNFEIKEFLLRKSKI